ncbi:MAG: hydroxyacylglutathione hydrolase [Xanthomonadales bacterium]|jgi:hydroxyacylglutathione hydrolase|nr:hydroxyacylglutathione hydrolase [Xanthomonadales bacterium]
MTTADLTIDAIPAFDDNYIWLLHRGGPEAVVVDPGDAAPVLATFKDRGLTLTGVLLTHHHWDHAGGVPDLLERWPDVPVHGPRDRRLGDWCLPVREGDTVDLPALGLTFRVLDVPAHTRSHVAFHGHGLLFSGDTLFSVGCGRLFEGSPEDMQRAMDKLAKLPADTLVYCGHEYTLDNCRFALAVEPGNEALVRREHEARGLREAGERTLPARLGEELAVNPFLRTREPAVVEAARTHAPDAAPGAPTMAAIRAWKDRF